MARPLIYSLPFLALVLMALPSAWAQQRGGGGGQQQQQQFGQQQQGFGQQQQGFGNTSSAQTGNTGSSGMFGRPTNGGVSSGNSFSSGQNSFGSSSNNSSMFGQSGSTGQQSTTQQQQTMGSQDPTGQRYTREGRQPGSFVGADNQDTVNLMSQMQGALGGMQGPGGMQGGNNQMNQFNQMNRNQNSNSRVQVRTRVVLGGAGPAGIDIARSASPVAAAKVQARIAKTPQFRKLGPIQLSVEGRTAVLRGTVPSEHDRSLAERVALLEPGISAVQNDLIVGRAASTEQAGN